MKNKHDQGFSLVEILVAIVILTAFVVPTCSALVMTARMNEKTDDLMKAQLAVSSAVETLMAEGIPEKDDPDGIYDDYGVSSKDVEAVVTDENTETGVTDGDTGTGVTDGDAEAGVTDSDAETGVTDGDAESGNTDDNGEDAATTVTVITDRFPEVKIKVTSVDGKPWYNVEVSDNDGRIVVNTSVRKVNGGGST